MAIVDTNNQGEASTALVMGTARHVTLYVFEETGSHNNHEIGLELSPDGTKWMPPDKVIIGAGKLSQSFEAHSIRAVVYRAEGEASTCDVYVATL